MWQRCVQYIKKQHRVRVLLKNEGFDLTIVVLSLYINHSPWTIVAHLYFEEMLF